MTATAPTSAAPTLRPAAAPVPDLARPDLARPDLARPDLARPEPGRPDLARRDPGRPDLGRVSARTLAPPALACRRPPPCEPPYDDEPSPADARPARRPANPAVPAGTGRSANRVAAASAVLSVPGRTGRPGPVRATGPSTAGGAAAWVQGALALPLPDGPLTDGPLPDGPPPAGSPAGAPVSRPPAPDAVPPGPGRSGSSGDPVRRRPARGRRPGAAAPTGPDVRPPLHLVPDIPLDQTPYDGDGVDPADGLPDGTLDEATGTTLDGTLDEALDAAFDEAEPELSYPPPPVHRAWMGRLGQAMVEVLAGDRAPQQLLPWTSASVYSTARRRAVAAARRRPNVDLSRRPPALLRSVQVSQPRVDVAEVCALVRHGDRTRAIAFRLEAWRGRWRCTAYELA